MFPALAIVLLSDASALCGITHKAREQWCHLMDVVCYGSSLTSKCIPGPATHLLNLYNTNAVLQQSRVGMKIE